MLPILIDLSISYRTKGKRYLIPDFHGGLAVNTQEEKFSEGTIALRPFSKV